jgi:hypothetical protein
MVKVAVRLPLAAGVNVTLNVQLLLAATELPQVVVSAKSPTLVPVIAMPLMVRATFPLLLSVTDWAALVVAMSWFPKAKLVAEIPAIGPLLVPVRLIV